MVFNDEKFKSSFEAEESVLAYWQKEKIFERSLEQTKDAEPYVFFDGPPFITGKPHYATLLPSIAKDVIPRYQTMKGRFVRRVWGWDVHGMPAEVQVEKQLGLKGKKDIETLGIEKFIDACRQYVATTSKEWAWYIDHIGRWVDFDNAYRTDQTSYMESVMWVFKELHTKGLIYRGKRVSLYCTRCATPLSKFEVTMDDDSYKDVEDATVTVKFKLVGEDAALLAWTTTPWTLPSNTALAVNPEAEYVKVTDGRETYILAHEALPRFDGFEIIEQFKGTALLGKKYQPLFEFFPAGERDYKIYAGQFVTSEEGTGVVHIAPGFGEDDTALGEAEQLSMFTTIGDEGHFVSAVTPWQGEYYKKANPGITQDLISRDLLFKEETITHSYPHCWRCGTPLIYKAQASWYMKMEPLRAQMLEYNKKINWVPKHFGNKRFAYNVENAPDWSISRTRYWGSPIPVWETDDGEQVVVGSLAELEKLSGRKLTDLHRPEIDEVEITTESGKKAKRVKEVLDCWFESGAMPYAQLHYPFAKKADGAEDLERNFPADFIIEYTGQLRGWYYYLHVLAHALRGENAFKNVVTTGVLMGTDGRKMSKSFGNYPDPKATIEKYGAEALRLYMMGSKIMSGEDMAMSEEDLREQSRLLQTLGNSLSYFVMYANLHNWQPASDATKTSDNLLDKWIDTRLEEFIIQYSTALDGYDFATSTRAIRPFVEDLSTWYIRRSRDRFVQGDNDALATLYRVLVRFATAVAPTLPFSAEHIYRTVAAVNKAAASNSVHLQPYPEASKNIVDDGADVLSLMSQVRDIASIGNKMRADAKQSLRQPLRAISLVGYAELAQASEFVDVLKSELNVQGVLFGELFETKFIYEEGGRKILLDAELTPELVKEGSYRELIRTLQDARKQAGLAVGEKVRLQVIATDPEIVELFQEREADICVAASLGDLSVKHQSTLEGVDDSWAQKDGLALKFAKS